MHPYAFICTHEASVCTRMPRYASITHHSQILKTYFRGKCQKLHKNKLLEIKSAIGNIKSVRIQHNIPIWLKANSIQRTDMVATRGPNIAYWTLQNSYMKCTAWTSRTSPPWPAANRWGASGPASRRNARSPLCNTVTQSLSRQITNSEEGPARE